ncbi:MAG: L-seryl-tRNA(Sec) selenium transferase, partial [Planctomycetota bacterium]
AGGGSLPTLPFATWTVMVRSASAPANRIAAALRDLDTPVIARVRDEAVCLDCRTVLEPELEQLATAIREAVARASEAPQASQ